MNTTTYNCLNFCLKDNILSVDSLLHYTSNFESVPYIKSALEILFPLQIAVISVMALKSTKIFQSGDRGNKYTIFVIAAIAIIMFYPLGFIINFANYNHLANTAKQGAIAQVNQMGSYCVNC